MTSVFRPVVPARLALGACMLMALVPLASAHGAHVHGQGHLQIVREGGMLHAELTVPGMDVVGFERVPEDETGKQAVRDALALLELPANVLRTPAEAGCTLTGNQADTGLLADDHDHHDHHHDHDHGHGDNHDSGHADFVAAYTFDCSNSASLDALDITLFDHLPGLERLIVQMVSDDGQREQRLRRGQRTVALP
ncbi:DUF2796 domain-containing protein [Isoalcanivorax indicus]|uniref:DUF2796 domain-containing protein n=1 Tax=Isoalcanivorax indicus TaxID=2202653 RepID=UPI0013C3EE4A|nr:DUF2796 domain-containing protein [Isoalcanivorax indicus]